VIAKKDSNPFIVSPYGTTDRNEVVKAFSFGGPFKLCECLFRPNFKTLSRGLKLLTESGPLAQTVRKPDAVVARRVAIKSMVEKVLVSLECKRPVFTPEGSSGLLQHVPGDIRRRAGNFPTFRDPGFS
jgi:hypothetical protein